MSPDPDDARSLRAEAVRAHSEEIRFQGPKLLVNKPRPLLTKMGSRLIYSYFNIHVPNCALAFGELSNQLSSGVLVQLEMTYLNIALHWKFSMLGIGIHFLLQLGSSYGIKC